MPAVNKPEIPCHFNPSLYNTAGENSSIWVAMVEGNPSDISILVNYQSTFATLHRTYTKGLRKQLGKNTPCRHNNEVNTSGGSQLRYK
jgi:hypothetical protein